jgi:hypothetical protein
MNNTITILTKSPYPQKTDMASIQQVFMNAIYYELSAISEYDALVDYVSEDDKVEPI